MALSPLSLSPWTDKYSTLLPSTEQHFLPILWGILHDFPSIKCSEKFRAQVSSKCWVGRKCKYLFSHANTLEGFCLCYLFHPQDSSPQSTGFTAKFIARNNHKRGEFFKSKQTFNSTLKNSLYSIQIFDIRC